MTIHSSILTWEIPWTEEPGRLQSMGSQSVGHDWETEHGIQIDRQTCTQTHTIINNVLISGNLYDYICKWIPRYERVLQLFIIARTWKQPRCPSADEWIRKLWYIYTMEYYSAIKKEFIWISSNEMDETGAHYTEWSKPER